MKTFFFQSFLLLTLLSLVGCGSQEKPVSLEVSSSFALGAAGFTGGLIAYGEGPNGKKFSVSAQTGKSVTANIVSGAWQIYIIGWEGAGMFQGIKQCGMISSNLGSSDTSVNVSISTAKCSDAVFEAAVDIQDVFTTSCGAFYDYNATSNAFNVPAAANDSYCATLPTELKYRHKSQRIVVQNIQDQGTSQGISSECIDTETVARRSLPTKKFPFIIKTYPNSAACLNSSDTKVAIFNFPNGLQIKNPASFDHEFTSNGSNSRLTLPSFMTRRGESPFMNMLPQVLCGPDGTSSDCIAAPAYSGVTAPQMPIHLETGASPKEQLLLRDVEADADVLTVTGLASTFPYTVTNLKIKDGNLYGDVSSSCGTAPCLTSFTVGIGASVQQLQFSTDVSNSVYHIFEKSFELIGRRFITSPESFYYFQRLRPEGDQPKTGGELSRARQMLGPDGIASFVSDFASCAALKTAIPSNGLTRTRTLFDMVDNTFYTYTGTFTIINEAITDTFCNNSNPAPAVCAAGDKFDLQIDYHNANSSDVDKGRIKLACGRKVGILESYENKTDLIGRTKLIWNTTNNGYTRFESYSLEDRTGGQAEVRASISKFQKTSDDDFWSRSVDTKEDSTGISSTVSQFQHASGTAALKSLTIFDTNFTSFMSNTGHSSVGVITFETIRDNLQFNTNSIVPDAASCKATSVTETQSPATTCTGPFTPITATISTAGIPVAIKDMIDITSGAHLIRAPSIWTLP